MRKINLFVTALCLGCGLIGSAFAAPLTTNYTSNQLVSQLGTQFDFPQFNPLWGTLTGITFTIIDSTDTGNINATGGPGVGAKLTFTAIPNDSLTIYDVLDGGLNFYYTTTPADLNTTPSISNGTVVPRNTSQAFTLTPTILGSNISFSIDNSSWSWSDFTGSSVVSFMAQHSPAISITATGGGSGAVDNIVNSSTLGITYTYTTVPEPSTYALFGLGGLALAVVYRRRRAA
jgi:hypothetical protein